MNFIEKILSAFGNLMTFLGDVLTGMVDFLAKPLSYLLAFLEGIFYFIAQVFIVVIEVIQLFAAIIDFFFTNITALFSSVSGWIGFAPNNSYHLPSVSRIGFTTALEQIGGTGLLVLVPNVIIGVLWIYFVIKLIMLFGDKGDLKK